MYFIIVKILLENYYIVEEILFKYYFHCCKDFDWRWLIVG